MTNEGKQARIDEYVLPKRIAKYIDKPVEYLNAIDFFDGIPFKVNYNGVKQYNYFACMKKLKSYGLKKLTTRHPIAKWSVQDILEDMGISITLYDRLVREGKLVEHRDDSGRFVYYQDYDYFIRNYVPMKMVRFVPPTMNVKDCAVFFGMTRYQLKGQFMKGNADIVYRVDKCGARRLRHMTRDQITHYFDKVVGSMQRKGCRMVKKEPLPDILSTSLAATYLRVSRRTLTQFIFYKWVHPEKVKKGIRWYNEFKKSELDELYNRLQRQYFYCEGRNYYTKYSIRLKFGKSDLWINTYLRGKCSVVVPTVSDGLHKPTGYKVVSKDEFAKLNEEARARGMVGYPMWGYLKEEVESIVASGVAVDPKLELSEFRKKHLDNLDRTNYRKRRAQRKLAAKKTKKTKKANDETMVYELPEPDSLEIAIKAALMEQEFIAEDKKRRVYAASYIRAKERNMMRRSLGLEEVPTVRVSNDDILQHSEIPSVVTILYHRSLGGLAPVLYRKNGPKRDELIYTAGDRMVAMRKKFKPQQSVFINISNVANKILDLHPKATPSWIVLAHVTSFVTDPSFIKKLEMVPSEYGAVAPFGYGYFLPDGTWKRCPDTYGMYSEFSFENNLMTKRIVGSVSAVGNHEVAVLDGPFVAIRGGYLSYLRRFHKLFFFGDGRGCVPYAVSMLMNRLGVKMQQIEVDSSWCVDLNAPFTPLEWNQLEPKFIEMGKVLVPKSYLKPKFE